MLAAVLPHHQRRRHVHVERADQPRLRYLDARIDLSQELGRHPFLLRAEEQQRIAETLARVRQGKWAGSAPAPPRAALEEATGERSNEQQHADSPQEQQ